MLDVSRKELKYTVMTEDVHFLSKRLRAIMDEDSHNGEEGYRVRSLYFDTFADEDYQEKIDGLDSRKKIRMRIYDGNTDVIKLEMKMKEGDFQRKRSLSLNLEEAEHMVEGDYLFLLERKEPFAHGLYTMLETRGYLPKCIVEYDRMAFMEEFNDIRITFDMKLRALEEPGDFFAESLELFPVTQPSETTMEVKYNGFLFSYIKKIVNLADRPRISSSKYVRARNLVM